MKMLTWIFRRRAIDRDLDAEIRQHFQMAIAERIAGGEDPESARLAAINEFGNVLQAQEEARQVWRGSAVAMLIDVMQDVRFGVRMLVKNPGFSLVVIGILMLASPATPPSSACSRDSRSGRFPASTTRGASPSC
jgi:hypothetical protein